MKFLTLFVWVLALGCGALAWWPAPPSRDSKVVHPPVLAQAMQPEALARCRIVRWESLSAQAAVMELAKDPISGQWQLPDHANYPADAGAEIGELAGKLLQLEFGLPIIVDDLSELSLVDPLSAPTALVSDLSGQVEEGSAKGMRITMYDVQNEPVIDVVLGKPVPTNPQQRYIRQAQSTEVFVSEFPILPETNLDAWVEESLFPVSINDVVEVVIDRYAVNEEANKIERIDRAVLSYDSTNSAWLSTFDAWRGKALLPQRVRALIQAATEMRFYGVEPFSRDRAYLAQRGLVMNQRGSLFANDGVVSLGCRDGLRYSFYFGQLVGDPDVVARLDTQNPLYVRDYRYCFVYVTYESRLDWRSDNGMSPAERKADGSERARQINAQRGPWFYLIDDIDFRGVSVLPENLHRTD